VGIVKGFQLFAGLAGHSGFPLRKRRHYTVDFRRFGKARPGYWPCPNR
jgi:hypothetical protein